jgi:hypothetical protein
MLTMAECNVDGTCGIRGCIPDTCEDLGATCGPIDDGCGGRRNCGTCDVALGQRCDLDVNTCVCDPDTNEPNDSSTGRPSLANLPDEPDSMFSFDGTIHVDTDEDWYAVTVEDAGFGGNPIVTVELLTTPAGEDYDIAAYFVCTSGGDSSTCSMGLSDNMLGRGCTSTGTATDRVSLTSECSGITDSGTVYIRVRAASWGGACGMFTARITVT